MCGVRAALVFFWVSSEVPQLLCTLFRPSGLDDIVRVTITFCSCCSIDSWAPPALLLWTLALDKAVLMLTPLPPLVVGSETGQDTF